MYWKKDTLPKKLGIYWRLIKVLGEGWEGCVYLIQDKRTRDKKILKVFHQPLPDIWAKDLRFYADNVAEAGAIGLSPIELVLDSSEVIGLLYPYQRLYQLNRRILWSVDQIGQSLVGSYCRMQCYLMKKYHMGLWDVSANNFGLDRFGQYWFIDFGYGLASLENPVCLDRGLFEYGFVMLLLSIYDINLREIIPHAKGYSCLDTCIYSRELDNLVSRCDWAEPILNEIHDHRENIFLDPDFYCRIGRQLSCRVRYPVPCIIASEFMSGLARLRIALWRGYFANSGFFK